MEEKRVFNKQIEEGIEDLRKLGVHFISCVDEISKLYFQYKNEQNGKIKDLEEEKNLLEQKFSDMKSGFDLQYEKTSKYKEKFKKLNEEYEILNETNEKYKKQLEELTKIEKNDKNSEKIDKEVENINKNDKNENNQFENFKLKRKSTQTTIKEKVTLLEYKEREFSYPEDIQKHRKDASNLICKKYHSLKQKKKLFRICNSFFIISIIIFYNF